jgi:protein involved in polysaccharide export with SLBB domain
MRFFRQYLCRYARALCPLALVVVLAACGTTPPADAQAKKPSPEEVEKMLRTYPLRVGDKVKVELTGIPDKMDPYERDIKEDGTINLPYINDIPAATKSPSQLEMDITAAYTKGFFTHINVTVTPMARFFFVMGMVNSTGGSGRILYTPGITILGAISAAGDFNPFADKRHVQVTRVDGTIRIVNCIKAIKHPDLDLPVYPGDKINVPRRVW